MEMEFVRRTDAALRRLKAEEVFSEARAAEEVRKKAAEAARWPKIGALPRGVTMAEAREGAQIFHKQGNCYSCHGVNAKGTALAPDLTDSAWININGSFVEIVHTDSTGIPMPKLYPAPMPPMGGGQLTAEQIRDVSAYVYSISRTKNQDEVIRILTDTVQARKEAVAEELDSGSAAYRKGDFRTASLHFRRATKLGPKVPAAWYGVYMAEHAMGHLKAADSAGVRANQLAPGVLGGPAVKHE